MRELYEDYCQHDGSMTDYSENTPSAFFEPNQPHVLLGIANIFLQVSIQNLNTCDLWAKKVGVNIHFLIIVHYSIFLGIVL